MSRDPSGQDEAPDSYVFVSNNGISAIDRLGLWKNVSGKVWQADEDDTLQNLATKVGAEEADWVCIWPSKMATDGGYKSGNVCAGDRYDVSNLKGGVSSSLTLSVSKDVRKFRGRFVETTEVVSEIKRTSNEGGTPIQDFILEGHGGSTGMGGYRTFWGGGWAPPDGGKALFSSSIYAGEPDPTPAFDRAKTRKGSKRCWFTRSAEVRFAGCHTSALAEDFARIALRDGAHAYGTKYNSYISPGEITVWPVRVNDKITITFDNWKDRRVWNRYRGGL